MKNILKIMALSVLACGVFESNAQPQEYGVFRENWALIKQEGMYGFIDINGKVVVPCQYDRIYEFGA
ncbi:MAG: WG repeat-containing protein, partial [Bacteroidia bacterium]|nr:WG repeat-containing protein [Bacteroidia bacterium]